MRRLSFILAVPLSAIALTASSGQSNGPANSETILRTLDLRQKDMVARGDIEALAALSSPKLTINAPTGRVLTRAQFLAMMRNGQIGAEDFERTVESVAVSADVGVVMGSELFTPTARSELGRTYGTVPLKRRYTNIYVREGGSWKWFARHANVVPTK